MQAESLAKAYILTHGVHFTPDALDHATRVNAKRQNAVYNLPAADSVAGQKADQSRLLTVLPEGGALDRPQELFLTGDDGYTVCVSAVAPVPRRESAKIACRNGRLTLTVPGLDKTVLPRVAFVTQPAYYDKKTRSDRDVKRWISACGYDEMNVWPWHDCAIEGACSFCGINTVQRKAGADIDLLHALDLRRELNADTLWQLKRDNVLTEITEAVELALNDPCYRDEIHMILISGNLANHQLDTQAKIYADIAAAITRVNSGRFAEVVAVTAPPCDLELLTLMCEAGIEVGVFNLEAYGTEAFAKHCRGKHRIGRDHYIATLLRGVEVFGWGRSWCNFVLGLEPAADLLTGCEDLASRGVTPGANVLHRDHGASVSHTPPDLETTIGFYRELANIYRRHHHRPYYCQLALRTSLANEAYVGRLN